MLKLENIESKTHVLGIEPTGAVRVIDVETSPSTSKRRIPTDSMRSLFAS
jgi:hypothetical protein